jgi:hypothetical protein
MRLRIATLALALTAAVPAAAQAAPDPFNDRVVHGQRTSHLQAKARQAGTAISVPTKEGYSVSVTFTAAVPVDPALANAYVAFLDNSVPHNTELAKLKLLIANPSEVASLCGGQETDGIVACYGGFDQQMIVPSTGLDTTATNGGYPTAYVLTHEYGHHIAANRSNQGFSALDYGPKYWASYEMVCDKAGENLVFPGDEGEHYLANPGEAWAETYARLVFPEQEWTFTALLAPDAGALDAARRDVLTPWTKNRAKRFTMSSRRRTQSFHIPLTLDGSLKATVRGPRGSDVKLTVLSGTQHVGATKRRGARHMWTRRSHCRDQPVETLTFKVNRFTGSGPVRLRVAYAG